MIESIRWSSLWYDTSTYYLEALREVSGWVPCSCHSRTVNHFCASVSIDTSWVPDEGGCRSAFFFGGISAQHLGLGCTGRRLRSIWGCGFPAIRAWDYGEDALPKDLSLVLEMIGAGSCDFFSMGCTPQYDRCFRYLLCNTVCSVCCMMELLAVLWVLATRKGWSVKVT